MIPAIPALQIIASMIEHTSKVASMAAATAPASLASTETEWTSPFAESAWLAWASRCSSMSHRHTTAPESSKRSAVA